MISNSERREVARRLREIEERTMLDITDGELLDLLAEAVGLDGYEGEHFEGGLLYCLADLIDRPTCRKVILNEMEGHVFCSKCGAEIGEYSVPNYCPRCGAEVVE